MYGLVLTTKSFFPNCRTEVPSFSSDRGRTATTTRTLYLNQRPKPNAFTVFASQEEPPELNSDDLMELKFGRLLGEDPNLTLAKIMGRKVNPDASYLDIEKSYYKKGKTVEVEEVPFEGSKEGKLSSKLNDLGLVRPVPMKGAKFKSDDNKVASEIKKSSQMASKAVNVKKSSVPNVILRKPTVYKEDDSGDMSSRLRIKANLSLKMRNGQVNEKFSDMTLLRKPEPSIAKDTDRKQEPSTPMDDQKTNDNELKMRKEEPNGKTGNSFLVEPPQKVDCKNDEQFGDAKVIVPNDGMELNECTYLEFHQEQTDLNQLSDLDSVDSRVNSATETALQGKLKRLDQYVKQTSKCVGEETAFLNPGCHTNNADFKKSEDADWTRAEDLVKSGYRVDVEPVSCSTKGFVVSFGSLAGFIPYRYLASGLKFFAFETWLRAKGLDPSIYKRNLSIIPSYDDGNKHFSPNSDPYMKIDSQVEEKVSPDMKLEDLLKIYDQEKIKFLSSFIGQTIKANVLLADRKLRKLIFSVRPIEKEVVVEKKRSLMARLQVGDIVKCCIQKITYFGIFVEVEGVPALIHQTEVSWDATLDPVSCFKIGQVVEAKVHQLNFALERIFLSLKEIMPDPLMDSLESVVGGHDPLDGSLEAAQTDAEWPEVESLIQELQQMDGIQSVSKGRFFRSPALAPTFQVYMASIFENQYKLLARSGNRIQEVVVETSLDKEKMKSAVLTCANRVE